MESNNSITVLGSLNGDIFMKVKTLPKAGETISVTAIEKASGGKGANQAGACAKLNAQTTFLWQVGKDEIGQMVLDELKAAGCDISHVKYLDNTPTGQAYIFSLPNGENSIIIVGGANTAWDDNIESLDEDFVKVISNSKILLLQREVPEAVNILAAKTAKENGVIVVLDAGGMDTEISEELLSNVDIFSPNETELERVLGSAFDSNKSSIENSKTLHKYPKLNILLKLGEKGSAYIPSEDKSDWDELEHHETIEVSAVQDFKGKSIIDTTGAGDCFTGAFATWLAAGKDIKDAMEYANTAAFLCITKFGAQPSLPSVDEVIEFNT